MNRRKFIQTAIAATIAATFLVGLGEPLPRIVLEIGKVEGVRFTASAPLSIKWVRR